MDVVASPVSMTAPEIKAISDSAETQKRKVGLRPSLSDGASVEDGHEQVFELTKTPLLKPVCRPGYHSPLRHHRRHPSAPKQVKESLNARSEYITSQDDGVAEHRINQYIIKQEIGRGSFGAVHLAIDQYGHEYAVKEFSKARLRKRAQSHILRKPLSQRRGALQGFNSPLHRNAGGVGPQWASSIDLIKEEIAIMKKLNHPNLVSLIEVLDDPSEDSLYMVMEMCKKGVVMRVGLEEQADPYPDDMCRYWFRDLILGIEYLHAQGVIHRDIKPDNCLITEDDVLKVVDFGVSEMFQKDSEMLTAKSAGSPAFLPPELCVARHGDVSGKAADIWSMGVTLFCLKYGRIPFERAGIFELYEAIKTDQPDWSAETDEDFRDLMTKILEKDPAKRIKMPELREHPWVTKRGTDPLLSEAENTADLVEPPTEAEMNAAITSNMRNLLTVVKAVNKFKALLASKRPPAIISILGDQTDDDHFSQPPNTMAKLNVPSPSTTHTSQSLDATLDRGRPDGALAAGAAHRDTALRARERPDQASTPNAPATGDPPPMVTEESTDTEDGLSRLPTMGETGEDAQKLPPFRSLKPHAYTSDEVGHRGHAHDPLEDHLYLFIGPSTFAAPSTNTDDGRESFMSDEDDVPVVSESPGAADYDIYETAYRDEIERIRTRSAEHDQEPNVYLTRRVDQKLLAISGLAGKWAAYGEEAKNQIKTYTQFSERKARVTEVSLALRQAARQEYERQKQERHEMIAAKKAERARHKEEAAAVAAPAGGAPKSTSPQSGPGSSNPSFSDPSMELPPPLARVPSAWREKAVDKGRQARTSLLGFVDMVKSKRARSKDELS